MLQTRTMPVLCRAQCAPHTQMGHSWANSLSDWGQVCLGWLGKRFHSVSVGRHSGGRTGGSQEQQFPEPRTEAGKAIPDTTGFLLAHFLFSSLLLAPEIKSATFGVHVSPLVPSSASTLIDNPRDCLSLLGDCKSTHMDEEEEPPQKASVLVGIPFPGPFSVYFD